MQRPYRVLRPTQSIATSDPEFFLESFEGALEAGERFTVSIARSASRTLRALNDILREHGVELQVDANSDPEAADYLANALLGGVAGAAGGAGTAAALWTVARLAGSATPLGPFVIVGSLIGLAVGAATSVAVARWGLTVRFVPTGSKVELELAPIR